MPIYKRGEVWWYKISLHGRTERGSCKTKEERLAQEFHDRLLAKLWRVEVARDKVRRTWRETCEKWLAAHAHKRSIKDDHRYAQFWGEEFERLGVQYLDQITPDVVDEVKTRAVAAKTRHGGQTKNATVNRRLAFLRAVINAAYRSYRWVEGTPPLFDLLPESGGRNRFLSASELYRLLSVLPEPYASLAKFAVSTGMRQGNCLKLRWEQIDLSRRSVTFESDDMKNGNPLTIPLNDTALEAVLPWVGMDPEWVFVKNGQPLEQVSSKIWKKALLDAGLEDFRWHDLRHTWASIMRQGGVSLDVLQELGGWKQQRMVQRYAHLTVAHLMNHSSMFDQLISNQLTKPHVQKRHSA
jgi:integrase